SSLLWAFTSAPPNLERRKPEYACANCERCTSPMSTAWPSDCSCPCPRGFPPTRRTTTGAPRPGSAAWNRELLPRWWKTATTTPDSIRLPAPRNCASLRGARIGGKYERGIHRLGQYGPSHRG